MSSMAERRGQSTWQSLAEVPVGRWCVVAVCLAAGALWLVVFALGGFCLPGLALGLGVAFPVLGVAWLVAAWVDVQRQAREQHVPPRSAIVR